MIDKPTWTTTTMARSFFVNGSNVFLLVNLHRANGPFRDLSYSTSNLSTRGGGILQVEQFDFI